MKITFATTLLLFGSLALEAAEWPPQEPSNTKTFNGRTTETLLLRNSFLRPGFLEAEEPGKVGCKPGMGRLFLPFNVGSTREISTDNLRE